MNHSIERSSRSRSRRGSAVPHAQRPGVVGPVHVVVRIRRGLPSLRTPRAYRVLERAFRAGKEKAGFGLCHFSVQRDHLHFVVDVLCREALSRGMQGLLIRIAKALNRHWHGRHGSVFAERYFARWLRKPKEIWLAVRYVLSNARKHGVWSSETQPDPFSSGRWFKGWSDGERVMRPLRRAPVALVERYSLYPWQIWTIGIAEVPGSRSFEDPGETFESLHPTFGLV